MNRFLCVLEIHPWAQRAEWVVKRSGGMASRPHFSRHW